MTTTSRAAKPTIKTKPPISTDDVLMTVEEVALLDRTSTRTVRRAIAAGHLAAVRIGSNGRSIRITRAAHAAYRQRLMRGH